MKFYDIFNDYNPPINLVISIFIVAIFLAFGIVYLINTYPSIGIPVIFGLALARVVYKMVTNK